MPMPPSQFRERLFSDYTLFLLNDPATTRFYLRNIDYLVSNFPYLPDIELVADYFTAENKKFSTRFRTRLPQFLRIIEYGAVDSGPMSMASMAPALSAAATPAMSIFCLYPSDDEGAGGSSRPRKAEAHSSSGDDDLASTEDSRSSLSSTESTSDDLSASRLCPNFPPGFPNHNPVGEGFVHNSVSTVLQQYARVLSFHAGSYSITGRFVRSLVSRLDHPDIHNLLVSLLQDGPILPMLLSNNCIPLLISHHHKSLCALLENILHSTKNNIEDEEEFIDQVETYKTHICYRFLELGFRLNFLSEQPPQQSSPSGPVLIFPAIEEPPNILNLTLEYSDIYKILHILCMNRNGIGIHPIPVPSINRFTLYYIRLLSYNQSFSDDTELVISLINHLFSHPNNAHLQLSVIRVLIKVNPNTLKRLGFFERMRDACYGYISMSKREEPHDPMGMEPPAQPSSATATGSPSMVTHMSSPQMFIPDSSSTILGPNDCEFVDSLFSFLIRLYQRYSSFIRAEYPQWEVFHDLMAHFSRLERVKYKPEDLDSLLEYEGFQRFVIERMLTVLPYPSIFKEGHKFEDLPEEALSAEAAGRH